MPPQAKEEKMAQASVPDYKDPKFAHFDQGGYGIDPRDVDTPDNWVPRHPSLIRLTGRHPFNVEPPLSMLMEQGLITPPALHFVRDHGCCPKLDWDTHTFTVSGLVDNPITLTMDEVAGMETVTFPCTVTCAGNRRKEQNMTKQTVGFNWGAAGTSTSIWTGVRLRDVLLKAGVKDGKAGAQYVCFEGADKLPNGYYGTSMLLAHAMDPLRDVILAFEQNGQRLTPDHGYPIRMIIPGWIGGRMVKWLTKIMITDKESDNYYHYFDNRILPPQVDKEIADRDGWWYKPEYLFNELNINSAISSPAHGEVLPLATPGPYVLKGWAYSGGGRKVTRVETSLDGGNTWDLSELEHLQPNASGYMWTWCHWSKSVTMQQLMMAVNREIMVRAWDAGSNTQPRKLTWNVMGMGNNPIFRVKVHACPSESSPQGLSIWFEHPTVAGPAAGGWMVKPSVDFPTGTKALTLPAPPVGHHLWQSQLTANASYSPLAMQKKAQGSDAAPPTPSPVQPVAPKLADGTRVISMEEVGQHASEESSWIVVKGRVYDCTPFLEEHPGGAASITMNAGMDCTEDFEAVHSSKAWKQLEDYFIGVVGTGARVDGPTAAPTIEDLTTLDPKKKVPVTLVRKETLSHDTRRLRFALPTDKHVLGLPVGNHFFVMATVDGKPCMRAYTPVSTDDEVGYFELVVKVYFKNVHPKFPDGGKMSQHFEGMSVGDRVEIKGPIGHFTYLGKGTFKVKSELRTCKKMGFICGGTGLTPAYQVIKKALRDEEDATVFHLLYANQTPDDILLREELDAWAKAFPDRVKVWYTVDRVKDGEAWEYSKGFINDEMLKAHLPPPPADGEDSFIGMCGPPPMINFACIPNLTKLGFLEQDYISF
mmetsp:Transcript_55608/g.130280  ORF Transcript_55608/g.130280 Transcript_55608/m.130280 type:complete len:874 (-) Transcript_55608:259-2880(-)